MGWLIELTAITALVIWFKVSTPKQRDTAIWVTIGVVLLAGGAGFLVEHVS